ncbi:MAG: UDP-N-acetylmuramoyl-L-alanine--D-glutamate ligase [Methylobacter sp.]|nr:UDP-N-acetylmuramoyl-L-alanine--D-glutamate ligase [Methylobacter sp.]MDP2098240.1 UDP-N-acetylmuramoyl-L-alanine--D-glutamate ligase [Methylobacter sp.]MDP2426737.1 UDP-N-acetylmuramoyl-L-alanine--D-glutamate ligase [Methylobacter sp.]MDP3054713.1 UDP-N-acetylmuramoyl-L-alanine--D-glutamate ligase [Methylobacter sp.]MDP3361765.1 UDP-N-acetylmuramoyl-L-alanine--D-glutamate ligase [Methylobacter sp.]
MDGAAITALLSKHFGLDPQASKILVVGLGNTGISVARYWHGLGFKFAIIDSRDKPPMMEEFFQQMPDTPVFTGGFDEAAFQVATHLVVSPGVSLDERAIIKAIANGARIVSDIDLFACSTDAPIVAITGSNGKSTVTTMLGEMVKAAGIAVGVGGNLGTPALDLLALKAQFYVLELSSFQLERTSALNAAAATVLNISADHLDRHADLADYARQKQRVFRGDGVMVINADDPVVSAMRCDSRKMLTFSINNTADFYLAEQDGTEYLMYNESPLMPLAELPLEGRHNAANALVALALGTSIGLDAQTMCAALRKFKGLSHRMQRVAEIRGVTWVNDSKATNIGACVAALQGYARKVVLIAGGDAKGADMNELTPAIKEKAKSVVLMGKDAGLIKQALNGCVPVYSADNMMQAVQIAAGLADVGESVLLSPACASLDQYKNYQDRGDKFTKAVLALVDGSGVMYPSSVALI